MKNALLSDKELFYMKRFTVALGLLTAATITSVGAVEGMWQPHQMPQLAEALQQAGLELDPESISRLDQHPMTAIVSLGFCSASFVSPQGLIVTNHHCAYGAIQYNSTDENNLLEKGFYAAELKDELPGGPGLYVYVTEAITDVSERIIPQLQGLHGLERYNRQEEIEKALIRECEKDETTRCSVYTFHGGLEFFLVQQRQIRDVRLVYAPAESIGKFGGDTDNWMWPRHTGDFSFLRAYVSPKGESVQYSPDNVPYQPVSHLRINPAGLKEGDFAMVLGYPGRTNRHRLAEELQDAIQWRYPMVIRHYGKVAELIEQAITERPDAAVKYASTLASINNYTKNAQGMLDGFANPAPLEAKRKQEARFRAWAEAHGHENALQSLEKLQQLLAENRKHRQRDFFFGLFNFSHMVSSGHRLYRFSVEKEKPDAEREPAYQKRNWDRIRNSLERLQRRFDPQVEQAIILYALEQYLQLPASERIPPLDRFFGFRGDDDDLQRARKKLAEMYDNTGLKNQNIRLAWLERGKDDLRNSDDPFLQLAVALFDWRMAQEQEDKALSADLEEARMHYMAALLDFARDQGRPIYADANGSLRITFGKVMGYSPRDAIWYRPFTSLRGIEEKYTGEGEFAAPASQMQAIAKKDFGPWATSWLGSVPVNFLTDLDITGGNSGSATLDGQARLVGLAFDGNYESINADWVFKADVARTIHVDIRYMLWVMDRIDHADRLLEEMQINP